MRGMSYYAMEDYVAALPFFQIAQEARQEDIQLKLKIGECMFQNRDARGGGKRLMYRNYFNSTILSLADKNRDARILMLKYYVAEKKLKDAEEILSHFSEEEKKDSNFYEALAQYYLKKDKMTEAEDIAVKHFSATSDWMKTMQQIVDRLRSAGNYEALEKIYVKIIEQAEDKLPYQKALAELYRLRGEGEKEGRLLGTMMKDYPDMIEVKRDYINFLNHYNRQGQAESFISAELNKRPKNIELQKLLIDSYVKTGQMQKAFQTVEKIIATIPEEDKRYFAFRNVLADLNFRSGEYGKSKKIVEEILHKHRLNRDARFLLCKIYLQEGDTLSAIGELRQLISENPAVAEFSYNLGLAHEMRGETILAEKAFRRALDVAPDYKDALLKWIAVYPKEGSLSEAELKIKKYLDLHPEDTEIKALQQTIQEQKTGILTSSNVSEK
jgi:tetratricopeptide (TPR) repeat protein